MGFAELLFSAQGRAPRLPSLIATAALLMLAAFYEATVLLEMLIEMAEGSEEGEAE